MNFRGIQKVTLIDFPERIAATLFVSGCNFRCGFCYNRGLVLEPEKLPVLKEKEVISFLHNREGLLDGVCVSGGEPTLHKGLPAFLKKVKEMGFETKLDTNGSNPEMLKEMLKGKLLDYIAMDIKAPPERYDEVCGVKVDNGKINESISLIRKSGKEYEFRTTVVPGLIDEKEILAIGKWLKESNAFFLQQFRNQSTLKESFEGIEPYSREKMEKLLKAAKPFFKKTGLRGL